MVRELSYRDYIKHLKKHKNKNIVTYRTNMAPFGIEDLKSKDGYAVFTSNNGVIATPGEQMSSQISASTSATSQSVTTSSTGESLELKIYRY
jgi:hypothetical protein